MKNDVDRTKKKKVALVNRESPRTKSSAKSSCNRSRTANWTHILDTSLLAVMKQEYVEGNFNNGQFPRDSWARIVQSFNSKTRLNFTRDHLRNRLKVLRNVFRLYDNLSSMSGWTWDSELNVPRPDDPSMWDRIIAINPQYAKCREKPCQEYLILKLFFTKDMTNQTHINDAMTVELTDKEDEGNSSIPKLPPNKTPVYNYYQNNNNTPLQNHTPLQNNTPLRNNDYNNTNINNNDEYEEREDDSSSDMMSEKSESIAKALEELSELNKRQQEIIQYLTGQDVSIGPKQAFSTEQCIAKLKTVRNLSPEAFLGACEAFRDKHERKVFMSLNGKTLQAWIQRKAQPFLPQSNHFRNVNHSNEVDFP